MQTRIDRPKNSSQGAAENRPILRANDRVVVNIWPSEKNIQVPGLNVGHASLETPRCYISLWPAPRDPQAQRPQNKIFPALQRTMRSYFKERPPLWKPSYLEDAVTEAICEEHYREISDPRECNKMEHPVALLPDGGLHVLEEGEQVPDDATLIAVTPAHAIVRIALYGLQVMAIEEAFNQLKGNVSGWRLVGSHAFMRMGNGSTQENCASMVYRLLIDGGIYSGLLKARASSQNASVVKPDALIRHLLIAKRQEVDTYPETNGSDFHFTGESNLSTLERAHGIQQQPKSLLLDSRPHSSLFTKHEIVAIEEPKQASSYRPSCMMM